MANAQSQAAKPAAEAAPQKKTEGTSRPKIDKSALTIGEPKRIRCKEHLSYVASQPCVICGQLPSHAHHVQHAQSRGLGLKVSDEPCRCAPRITHGEIHHTTRENEWWQERNIDPIAIAADL